MSEKNVSGITKIAVKGFKSIAEECEIDIRPLTILAGANSSGKSSIMQPLLLLKQTLEAPYDPGPLLIDGPNAQFTETAQFLSTLPGESGIDSFQIRIETDAFDVSDSVTTVFRKGQDEIEIIEMTAERKLKTSSSSMRFTLFPDMSPEDVKSLTDQPMIPRYSPDELPEELRQLEEFLGEFSLQLRQNFMLKDMDSVTRSRCFLHLSSQNGYGVYDITSNLAHSIRDSIHLPGLRGNPERTYKMTGTGPRYPGTFENYVASVIHEWQAEEDKRLKSVVAALRVLKVTGQVGTEKIGDARIELQVGRLLHGSPDETDMVSIADVGFGVSQVLPVLVALAVARSGQIVYLEQPELHLHPRAQVALARMLVSAAKRGVRVIVETHSSLLLLGVQTFIAEGKLSPELVKLHWFSRREDGVTEVNSTELDEAGAYGEWPEDFDDVDLKAQSRYIKAAQSRFVEGT